MCAEASLDILDYYDQSTSQSEYCHSPFSENNPKFFPEKSQDGPKSRCVCLIQLYDSPAERLRRTPSDDLLVYQVTEILTTIQPFIARIRVEPNDAITNSG